MHGLTRGNLWWEASRIFAIACTQAQKISGSQYSSVRTLYERLTTSIENSGLLVTISSIRYDADRVVEGFLAMLETKAAFAELSLRLLQQENLHTQLGSLQSEVREILRVLFKCVWPRAATPRGHYYRSCEKWEATLQALHEREILTSLSHSGNRGIRSSDGRLRVSLRTNPYVPAAMASTSAADAPSTSSLTTPPSPGARVDSRPADVARMVNASTASDQCQSVSKQPGSVQRGIDTQASVTLTEASLDEQRKQNQSWILQQDQALREKYEKPKQFPNAESARLAEKRLQASQDRTEEILDLVRFSKTLELKAPFSNDRLAETKRLQASLDRTAEIDAPVRFSKTFKLKAPNPDDLGGLLNKDPDNQESIMTRAQKDSEGLPVQPSTATKSTSSSKYAFR